MIRRLARLGWLPLAAGCSAGDVQETAQAYYGHLPDAELAAKVDEMARVMPFYVSGAVLALVLSAVAILNGLEHARSLGRTEAIRYGAYLFLLCFVALFLAMNFERAWLPAGHPVPAFLGTLVLGAASTAVAARARPERAVLTVGYLAAGLTIPLIGVLIGGEVHLVDTTASLFIGFATGLLLTIVLSAPVRDGLVDFLRRRESAPP